MLEVENLSVQFKVKNHSIQAIDNISFSIPENTVVGLVGESGSGKSVTSLSLLNLLPANGKITAGKIRWNNEDLVQASHDKLKSIRGKEIGMIFQNPLASLNPVFTIGNQMIETIMLHHALSKTAAKEMAIDLLTQVNIPDAQSRLNDYPHQFSIGMCQRIMIALTLSMHPKLLIADEPTASLDVTVQAQVLDLMKRLQKQYAMSILMISHDLGVIAQFCDHIMVMYLGSIVESGTPTQIFKTPKHPYTQALIAAIPNPDPTIKTQQQLLTGDIPSPMNLPTGCRFHTRCPKAMAHCKTDIPKIKEINNQKYACFL